MSAITLDDLIGSMQGVHAGDRGQGLEEIRENLRRTLGPQAMGPDGGNGIAGPSTSYASHRGTAAYSSRRRGGGVGGSSQISDTQMDGFGQSIDSDAGMASGSYDNRYYNDGGFGQAGPSRANQFPFGVPTSRHATTPAATQDAAYQQPYPSNGDQSLQPNYAAGSTGMTAPSCSFQGPSSYGGTTSSSHAGSSGFALSIHAPANTPQQTPSDRSGPMYQPPSQNRFGGNSYESSGALERMDEEDHMSNEGDGAHQDRDPMERVGSNSPRKLVNGFQVHG